MVRPHYSVKRALNVLGHALLPFTPPGSAPLENVFCSQIIFQAVLKPLLLNPNNLVTLEKEALLYKIARGHTISPLAACTNLQ